MNKEVISNGVHYLSGIGSTTMRIYDWYEEDVDVNLFCIDGKVYGAYVDPDDGFISQRCIMEMPNEKCEYTFPPQKVIVENEEQHIIPNGENDYTEQDRIMLHIKDAILMKDVLKVGTDYTDSYYPYAIFDYQPMNLYANVEKQAYGYIKEN